MIGVVSGAYSATLGINQLVIQEEKKVLMGAFGLHRDAKAADALV